MAFTIDDFQDLLRLLEERPEWRAELRRHVLSDDILELPAIVRQLAERMGHLAERMDQLAERMDQLAERMDQLALGMRQLTRELASLGGRVGRMDGYMYESRYIDRAGSIFGRLLKGVRRVEPGRLADLLYDAADSGQITAAERDDAMLLDLVVSGRRREEQDDIYYAVEVSVGIGLDDVTRAVARAKVLSKLGQRALPVVGGEWLNSPADEAAASWGVLVVFDIRKVPLERDSE